MLRSTVRNSWLKLRLLAAARSLSSAIFKTHERSTLSGSIRHLRYRTIALYMRGLLIMDWVLYCFVRAADTEPWTMEPDGSLRQISFGNSLLPPCGIHRYLPSHNLLETLYLEVRGALVTWKHDTGNHVYNHRYNNL